MNSKFNWYWFLMYYCLNAGILQTQMYKIILMTKLYDTSNNIYKLDKTKYKIVYII